MTLTFARTMRRDQAHWRQVAAEAVAEHGALQDPAELAQLLAILDQARVRSVVEVGSDRGGTLWAWSQLPGPPRVVSVNLRGGPYSTTSDLPRLHGAALVEGDSVSPETYRQACQALDFRLADFCMIDSDHTFRGAAADWMIWRNIVRPGGLIALHDIVVHPGMAEVEVWRLWAMIASEGLARREICRVGLGWGGIGLVQV